MREDVKALLAVQEDDAAVAAVEAEIAALAPRIDALDRAREGAAEPLVRARAQLEGDERRLHELRERVAEHRERHGRNVAQLDQVRKIREADAAVQQIEVARRVLADEEAEVRTVERRIADLHHAIAAHEAALAELDERQRPEREAIDAERARLDGELLAARAKRDAAASGVERRLLATYEKIRSRHPEGAVHRLRGASCGACDTAIPLQRRSTMASRGDIEMCETCGVLLYAGE